MAWRSVPLFLAALVAVGLSSGNLSSAEKEKKKNGMDSRLERIKRSILWKQEVFVSDEKDSTSSEKLEKHRRCKRGFGSATRCSSRSNIFGRAHDRVFSEPPCEGIELCKIVPHSSSSMYRDTHSEVIFDLGEDIQSYQDSVPDSERQRVAFHVPPDPGHYWNPHPELGEWTKPRKFYAALSMDDRSKKIADSARYFWDRKKRLGRKTQFEFTPFFERRLPGWVEKSQENPYRFLTLLVPKERLGQGAIRVRMYDFSDSGRGKFLCRLTFKDSVEHRNNRKSCA